MEKKAGSSRSESWRRQCFSSWADNGKACAGCIFACGDTPMDNSPDKSSCLIYVYPKTKPDSVYLEGKPCKHKQRRRYRLLEVINKSIELLLIQILKRCMRQKAIHSPLGVKWYGDYKSQSWQDRHGRRYTPVTLGSVWFNRCCSGVAR